MSLTGHWPKHWSRNWCLIIAKTGPRGPVLYNAPNDILTHPKVAQPTQGSHLASNPSLTLNTTPGRSPAVPLFISHRLPQDRTWHKANDPKIDYSGGWGRGKESRTLLDYAGHYRPREGGPAEAGSLSASNLSLTMNTAPGRSVAGALVSVVHPTNRTSAE